MHNLSFWEFTKLKIKIPSVLEWTFGTAVKMPLGMPAPYIRVSVSFLALLTIPASC